MKPPTVIPALALLFAAACSTGDKAFVWEEWPVSSDGISGHDGLPRPEHPNPMFVRRDWLNLNGGWEFAFDPDDVGIVEDWAGGGKTFDKKINAPFPWNSPLSGVNIDTGDQGGIGWYRRTFEFPAAWSGKRVHLVVGAADWDSTVFVNGKKAAEHSNGYLPFRADITDLAGDGTNTVVIRVRDPGNKGEYPHGKQGTPWYRNVGGIWQTVYLEAVTAVSVRSVKLVPDLDNRKFGVTGEIEGQSAGCTLKAWARGHEKAPVLSLKPSGGAVSGSIPVPWLEPWEPGRPNLQEFEWRLCCGDVCDAVRNYSGLRSVERKKIESLQHEAVHLNGKPVFIRGVLDQGYNPDGIYTYPSESRIVADIEAAKSAGFNLVRLHIKVEEPLVLYHADRLGVLIDADVPSWGIFPYTSGYTPQARERWQATMEGMFARDFNHPSVIWWTLFNEDWGLLSSVDFYDRRRQEFVASMVKRARELDGTRLIEDHSTIRNDHVGDTDINSFHIYNSDPAGFGRQVQEWTDNLYPGSTHNCVEGAVQNGAPLINTEYGPFSYEAVPERERNRDISWGFRTLTSEFRKREKIAGYIFTELYDVEFEFNGFTRYDRRTKEFGYPDGITPADVNSADFVDLTVPWMEAWEGAAVVPTQAFVSRWGSDPTSGEMIRAVLVDGTTGAVLAERLVPVDAPRYRTTEAEGMQWSFAALPVGSYYFRLEWLDAEGRTIARNYTPVHILEGLAPKATCEGRKCVIPLNLEGCTGTLDRYSAAVVDGLMMAAGFLGEGRMECPPLIIPETVPLGVPLAVRFTGEMAANVDGAPQTDGTVAEGKASISFNGALLGEVELPPDRADSRGVLSCINGPVPPCGYGNPIRTGTVNIPGLSARTGTVRFEASGDGANGVIVYGDRMGRTGTHPSVEIAW